jgi:beta-glucosidase
VLEGLRAACAREGIECLYDKGCDIADPSVESIARAAEIASRADVAFLVIGDTLTQNGETHDRASLALTGRQNELARALRAACDAKGIPLVSVWVNGKPLEFAEVASLSDAIIECFNPGTLGGNAVADVAFGAFNPEGRLPISFPRVVGQIPVYYNQLPGWHNGKYLDCEGTPLFAFGEGLSYSDFRYESVSLSASEARAGDIVDVLIRVSNRGAVDGVETVQLYARDLVAQVVRPVRELKGFAKRLIRAGETACVTIPLPVASLALVRPDLSAVVEPGDFLIMVGHDSREESLISATLTVR